MAFNNSSLSFFGRWLCNTNWVHLCEARHEHLPSYNRVHELHAADVATFSGHEKLVPDHLLVHSLSVRHVGVDLVLKRGKIAHRSRLSLIAAI